MATVVFKRGSNTDMTNTPVLDGQLYFNETNNKIYMDVGNQRLQFGGDTTLVGTIGEAAADNTLNGEAIKTLFVAKNVIVDDYNTAITSGTSKMPLGCLAFKELYLRTAKSVHILLNPQYWSANTTTVNGKALYTYTETVSHIYSSKPTVSLSTTSDNILPTEAEQEVYNEFYGITFNSANNTIKIYSPTKPSITIGLDIEGVG
jgi:hypothetical protein